MKAVKFFLFFLLLFPGALWSREFGGVKVEYMNAELTNFYGFGFFTSNRRFDAEVEGFLSTKTMKQRPNDKSDEELGYTWIGDNYKFWYMAFSGYFHFIRSDKFSIYAGTGIMPLFPNVYVFHYTAGMDFFWHKDVRLFYNFRNLFNNAESYRFPLGPSFSVGLKYTFDI